MPPGHETQLRAVDSQIPLEVGILFGPDDHVRYPTTAMCKDAPAQLPIAQVGRQQDGAALGRQGRLQVRFALYAGNIPEQGLGGLPVECQEIDEESAKVCEGLTDCGIQHGR
jgi:hypothetical protein